MKICFVIDNLGIGGVQILTLEVMNYLSEKGHDISLTVLNSEILDKNLESRINPEIVIHKLTFPGLNIFNKLLILKKILQECDIVHSCLETANFFCSILSYFNRHKIFVSTIHGIDGVFIEDSLLQDKIKNSWGRKYVFAIKYLQNILFKNYSLFIAVSKNTKEFLVSSRKINPSKIKVIYHGINLQLLKNIKPDLLHMRENEIGKHEGDFVLGYVGRLAYGKGLENLVISFSNLSRTYQNIKLVLVGDGELKKQLEGFVKEKKLTGRCIITGFVDESKYFYELIDIFVLPSSSEGIPLTLLESMYMRKISVCSDVGGIPEVISDSNNGFLFRKNDFEAFEKILEFVINNRSSVTHIGENACLTIADRFDLEKNMLLIEEEFLKLTNNRPSLL